MNSCSKCQAQLSDTARFCERCGAMLQDPANPGADPLIGRVLLDRYRVLESIGQGGMGAVYLAEQRMGQASRKVAIKALRRDLTRDAQLAGRFHRESEIVIQLSHPNIIQFHDFDELEDGTLIIVMEYIEGGTLQALLKESGPLPIERVDHLLEQIVGALEEAHRQGVVHRDLKPQNILITTRGDDPDFVKVVDFGIAMRSGEAGSEEDTRLTSKGTVIGTPAYMSPEQFRGEEPDARADVYSLAVITYEMLTGKLPLQARTPWEWASQHLTAEPEPFATHAVTMELPLHVAGAVMRGLSKGREQRWADARSFLQALRGQPIEPSAATRVLPRVSRPVAPRAEAPQAPRLELPAESPDELPLAQTAIAPVAPAAAPRRGGASGWLLLVAGLLGAAVWVQQQLQAPAAPDAAAEPAALAPAPAPRHQQPPRPSSPGAEPAAAQPNEAVAPGAAPVALSPGAAAPTSVPADGTPTPQEQTPPTPPGPPSAPAEPDDQGGDPNQLLAREGLQALADGRLDFALTALDTSQSALGPHDSSVGELRTALEKRTEALLTEHVAAGRCAQAHKLAERLEGLGLRPSPNPLAGVGACAEIAAPEPPAP